MDPIGKLIVRGAKSIHKARILERGDGTRFLYNLNNDPPFVQAVTQHGEVYVMHFDGTTYWNLDGDLMLIQGCPYPHKVGATAEFRLFLHQNRRRIPAMILGVFLIVLSQVLLTRFVPANYAMLRWVLPLIASAATILLTLYGFVLGLIVLAKYAGPAVIEVWQDLAPIWAGGRTASSSAQNSGMVRQTTTRTYNGGLFRVGQDLMLVSVRGETGEQFEDRVLCAKRQAEEEETVYLAIIPYQSVYMQILYSEADSLGIEGHLGASKDWYGKAFHRDLYTDADTNPAPFTANIMRKGAGYTYEPWVDYDKYIDAICPPLCEWSEGMKLKYLNPTKVMLNTQKAVLNCLVFLLLSFSAIAQPNMDAAKDFFGKTARELAPIGPITFYFETLQLDGVGDGRKTFIDVLGDCPGFKNTDNGRLQFVYASEDQVIPEQTASVSSKRLETAEQPTTETSAKPIPTTSHTGFWDRMLPLEKIPGYKRAIDKGLIDAGKEIEPRREFLSYAFWMVAIPVLAALFFLFRLGARVCFKEMMSGHGFDIISYKKFALWGGRARIGCFVIIMLTAFLWIVNAMVADFFTGGYMIWVWLALTGIKCLLAYEACQYLIPNPPQTGQPYEDIIDGAAAPRHLRPGGR